jgi:hypothetical protein
MNLELREWVILIEMIIFQPRTREPVNLIYNTELGSTTEDSGFGPPVAPPAGFARRQCVTRLDFAWFR